MNLSKQPYYRREIETFLKKRLIFLTFLPHRPNLLSEDHKLFAQTILAYPAWAQIVLLETPGRILIGDREELGMDSSGSYHPGAGTIKIDERCDARWGVNGATVLVKRHEVGHKISHQIAGGQNVWFSDNAAWRGCVNEELKRVEGMGEDARQSQLRSLYPGAKDLLQHVNSPLYASNKEHNWPEEAVAEMFTHYATLLAMNNGDEAVAIKRFVEAYPILSEAFLGKLTGKVTRFSDKKYLVRSKKVNDLTEGLLKVGELAGYVESPSTVHEQASVCVVKYGDTIKADVLTHMAHTLAERISAGVSFDATFGRYEASQLLASFPNTKARNPIDLLKQVGRFRLMEKLYHIEMNIPVGSESEEPEQGL